MHETFPESLRQRGHLISGSVSLESGTAVGSETEGLWKGGELPKEDELEAPNPDEVLLTAKGLWEMERIGVGSREDDEDEEEEDVKEMADVAMCLSRHDEQKE